MRDEVVHVHLFRGQHCRAAHSVDLINRGIVNSCCTRSWLRRASKLKFSFQVDFAMYSPKEYVETVLSNALRDYVEEYEGSDFSFGLWQGDLSLSNLVLKPMTINIGDGMVSRMVFGSIDKLQVIIPWSQMSSGHVSVKVDTVNIVVQLSVDQSEDADHRATDTLLHKLKMAKIDSEERRLLGVSRSGGWKSRLMESLKSSVLSKLFSGMSAEVNKLKVSFVLPLPGENEVAHVQLVTESIVVNRQNTPASTDFDQIIGKSIDVRGVAVSLDRLQIAGDLDPQMLLERQPGGLVLNPMYFNSELKLCISSTGVMNVDMQIKLRNTEISLNLYQLRLAQEVLVYNTGESMRYTFRHLRPRVSVLANPKLWWQFAVKAVIHLMRHRDGGDSIGGSSSWSRKESVIAMRRRYQQLYKRHLENRLLTLRYPEEYAKFVAKHTDKSHSSALGVTYDPLRSPFLLLAIEEKWVQMHADEVQMDELHTFFSAKDILLYRAAVRQKTRKDRVSLSQALYSGVNGNSKHGSWFSVFSSPIASEDNIEKEILQLCLEFDRNTTAGTCSEVGSDEDAFALDITVSIPRIALCVSSRGAEKEDVSSPPRKHSFRGIPRTVTPPQKGQRGVSPKKRGESEDRFGVGDHTLFTFALYGVYTSLTKDQRHDRIIHLKLGSVVIFGVNGMNIVTIGSAEDTDRWLQDDDSRPEQLAIDSSFQWRQQGGERKGGFGSDIANSDSDIETDVEMSEVSKLSRGSKIHCVIAVTISTVKIHWDEQTHALFSKIKSDMLSQFLHLDKPKLFVAEKASCAQLSMNKSCLMDLSADVKFSVEINVQGVMFECPCVDPSSSDSTNHRFYQVGHTRQRYTEGRKSNKNLIRVLIRSFKVSGGDFLPMAASYAKLEESLQSIPTKNLWSSVDFLIEVLLSKLYCSVVHPFVYSVNAIELQFVTITTAPIANSTEDLSKKISIGDLALTEEVVVITGRPWSVACVVSPCVVRSHPIFPALRLDIFCSPLKLTLSMEVCCMS